MVDGSKMARAALLLVFVAGCGFSRGAQDLCSVDQQCDPGFFCSPGARRVSDGGCTDDVRLCRRRCPADSECTDLHSDFKCNQACSGNPSNRWCGKFL